MVQAMLSTGMLFLLLYGRLPLAGLTAGALCLGAYLCLHGHSHGAVLAIDRYARRSRLGRVHPGAKLCFALGGVFVCVAANSIAVAGFLFFAMLVLSVWAGGVPLRQYHALLALPATFILLGGFAILLQIGPEPLGLLDIPVGSRYLSVSRQGQEQALLVIAKAFGGVGCLYMLALSTPLEQIITVLHRIRVPAVMVELMYLIHRYLFVMLQTHEEMVIAARSRLGYRDSRTSLKTALAGSMQLLVLSFRRSSDCFLAMESRGYDGKICFMQELPPLRVRDILLFAGTLAVAALLWAVTAAGGGGWIW